MLSGETNFPSVIWIGVNVNLLNFDLALFFQGVADVSLMANGAYIDTDGGNWGANGVGIVPFAGMGANPTNIISKALDRWTEDQSPCQMPVSAYDHGRQYFGQQLCQQHSLAEKRKLLASETSLFGLHA